MNDNQLMEATEASEYTGTKRTYLNAQAKLGHITYTMPSPKKRLFAKSDLDTWMASWRRVEATER